jgi:hypothetical protein
MSAASLQARLVSISANKSHLSPLKSHLSPLKPPTPSPLVAGLLAKNHDQHDIFFNKDHFHNHFPHTLLSQFALGAPTSRLKKEWELEDYLTPLGKKQPTDITDENWKEFIGKDEYYHNYRDFFTDKIKSKENIQKTLVEYALNEALLPSFVSGLFHPMIHTGYGVEFASHIVVAEGLAEACVHKPGFAPLVDFELYSGPATEEKTLIAIVNEIYHDKSLDDVIKYSFTNKSQAFFKSKKAIEAVKMYVMKWSFADSPEGIAKAYAELFELATHFMATSAFPPPHIVNNPKYKDKKLPPLLDFFMMYVP